MSRLRVRVGVLLLGLYPLAWQQRYRDEVTALLEDDPPRLASLGGLLAGAAAAHMRPRAARREALPGPRRAQLSLTGMFACWIVLSVAGAAFQKETEEPMFASAESHHQLLASARGLVMAGAALGALAIAYGGLPLVAQAVRRAVQTLDVRLIAWLLAPAVAVAVFAAVSAITLAAAPEDAGGAALPTRLALLVPWEATGFGVAVTFALAPRAVLARMQTSAGSLRRAVAAGRLVEYTVGLWLQAPPLAAQSAGPVWPSTVLTLAFGSVLACVALALAVLAQRRAHAALRAA
jgi:hypothetical protein